MSENYSNEDLSGNRAAQIASRPQTRSASTKPVPLAS